MFIKWRALRVIFLIFFLGICQTAIAQSNISGTIRGLVLDTTISQPISNVSISILSQSDSIFYKGTRGDERGYFSITNIAKGDYILVVSKTGYSDFEKKFSIGLESHNMLDFGKIIMKEKIQLLNEVVVKGKKLMAISMNGDTIEFQADSFMVAPNARVEDLLRQLPNMKVEKNGKISYGGEIIKKVLVDGEEFFSSDPTLVTRNLRADMVEKIQVFDKTAKEAAFGRDDIGKEKTINLELKENKRKGYFGKLEGGYGTQDIYQGQIMLNFFNHREKIALYGIASNNGLVGLSWKDQEKYTNGETWDGNFDGKGIPTVQTGGLHYANKWDAEKQSINTSFRVANLDVYGNNNNLVQTNLTDYSTTTDYKQDFNNKSMRSLGEVAYEYRPSGNTSLSINVATSLSDLKTSELIAQQISTQEELMLSKSNRKNNSRGSVTDVHAKISWNQTFGKNGRSLLLEFLPNYAAITDDRFLNALNSFYGRNLTVDSIERIDQHKLTDRISYDLTTKFYYSEPLSTSSAISFNYINGYLSNNSTINSFNIDQNNQNLNLDPRFSSDYIYNQISNSLGLNFKYSKNKLLLTASADLAFVKLMQSDKTVDKKINKDYKSFRPQLRIKYSFNPQKVLILQYNMDNILPEIDQIQPLVTNEDPFNRYVGNTDLDISTKHTFRFVFRNFVLSSEESFLLSGSHSFTDNPIVNSVTTYQSGISTIFYQNLKNHRISSTNLNLLYSIKLGFLDLRLISNTLVLLGRNINLSNGNPNRTSNNSYSTSIGFDKVATGKYGFSLNGNISYNDSRNEKDNLFNNRFFTIIVTPRVDYNLGKTMRFSTGANINLQQRTSLLYQGINRVLWNASLTRDFADNKFSLKLSASDILNQNKGFQRFFSENRFTQNSYTTIKRNIMLSLTYDINKFETTKLR